MTFGQALLCTKNGSVLTRTYIESDTIVVVFCKYAESKRLMRKKVSTSFQSGWTFSGWSLNDMLATDWIVAG